jgi:chromosome partitioning protein
MDVESLFQRFAGLCREVQQKAIELENHPDKRKSLRRFSARETAEILGISPSHLRNLVREPPFPQGAIGSGGRRSFSLAEIQAARAWLHHTTGHPRYAPRRRRPDEKLQVVTFVNFKGGSGKTTSAIHFAQWLALQGYRVLLADLDPQASATALFGLAPATEVDDGITFAAWLRREAIDPKLARGLVRSTYWQGLDLLPANIGLQHAEYELVGRLLQQRDWPFYAQLGALLDELAPDYDVVICDCRPDVGMLTINALLAATGLVVPMPPSMIDFASSGEFFRFMAEVAADLRAHLSASAMAYDFVRILTTKYRPTDRNQSEMVSWTRALFGMAVLEKAMVETAVMDAAGILKETLYEYEPSGNRRTYERGLEAMSRVNAALEAELLRVWGRSEPSRREAA